MRSMCLARSKGVPLQYILGDQPFGDLQILCRSGVLIPRPETETFTMHVAKLIQGGLPSWSLSSIRERAKGLRVLDLCSGTGCISLLLHSLLASHTNGTSIVGVDLSPVAIRLCNDNLAHNVHLGLLLDRAMVDVQFRRGNVLACDESDIPSVEEILHEFPQYSSDNGPECDVLVSNPPYIAPEALWDGTTSRSVRIFEPTLALVPPATTDSTVPRFIQQEDLFYYHILLLGSRLRPLLTVLECGSRLQAERVVDIYRGIDREGLRDYSAVAIVSSAVLEGDNLSHQAGPCAVIIHRRQL